MTPSKKSVWIGLGMVTLVALFMAFDGIIHILQIPVVVEAFAHLGYPISTALGLGILELICLALYMYPKTSIFWATLLTGYLGGAIATNLRIEAPLFSTILFPVYVGIIMWGGLYLLEPRLRALFPLKK